MSSSDERSDSFDAARAAAQDWLTTTWDPDVTVRDVAKMQRLSTAVNELLDAAA